LKQARAARKWLPFNEISDERELIRSVRQQTCISLNAAEFKQAWDMLKARQEALKG
jgi:hypothetical protein